MRVLILIILFFVLAAVFIISNNNLYLSSNEDLSKFNELYADWFSGVLSNMGIITGEAVKMDWIPVNEEGDKFKNNIEY